MITKEIFEKWLHSADYRPLTYHDSGTYITYLKVPRDEYFDYLYHQKSYHGAALKRNSGFEYAGIHCKQDGLIYDAYNGFRKISPQLESPKSKSIMELDLTEAVRAIIDASIGNDRCNLEIDKIDDFEKRTDLIYYEQHIAPKEARKLFLAGISPDDVVFHCDYEHTEWSEDDLLDYIRGGEQFEINEAAEYIATHQEVVLMQFFENDLVKNELIAIEGDPQNRLHRIKAIIEAVNSVPAKTVNVRIDTPEVAFSFKTSADELRRDPGEHYSTWNITAADRREFEMLFGKGFSYRPEDIMRIDYNGKTLYEAEPAYIIEQPDEDESFGITM